jgi:hypothetical protein
VLDKLGEVQAEQARWAEIMDKICCTVTPSGATQAQRHSAILEAMSEHDQLTGCRLNTIACKLRGKFTRARETKAGDGWGGVGANGVNSAALATTLTPLPA